MKATKEMVNSSKLLGRLVEMRASVREAAEKCNMSRRNMQRLVQCDCSVARLTAEKLRQAFGADVIYKA